MNKFKVYFVNHHLFYFCPLIFPTDQSSIKKEKAGLYSEFINIALMIQITPLPYIKIELRSGKFK